MNYMCRPVGATQFEVFMRRSSRRPYRRTLDLDNIVIPGDPIVKASHIVVKSKDGTVKDLQRYHSVEDFVEIAFHEAIKAYERVYGEIKISPSGLYASDGDLPVESE
jgi:hypothetical protein